MWAQIGINFLSDFLFVLVGLVIPWIIYLAIDRRKLLNFFGIRKNKELTIYTSSLDVNQYGSTGGNGVPYSFSGLAIPYEESKASTQLQNLFNYFLPSQIEKPGILSKLLISDIFVKVVASPKEENFVEQSTSVISIGLPPYNNISKYIEDKFKLSAKLGYFSPNIDLNNQNHESSFLENQVTTQGETTAGSASPYHIGITSASAVPVSSDGEKQLKPVITVSDNTPFSDTSIGFVQRILDDRNKRSVFYIAGLSENSTAGSAYYLIANWKKLFSKYGSDMSFLVLLKIGENNHLSEVIFEK